MDQEGRELTDPWTGGCQCGAVRFTVARLRGPGHLCHCRMCQRAVGSLVAALVPVARRDLTWSRPPDGFRSSAETTRHFCARCGTSLGYDWGGEELSLSVAAFDAAARIAVTAQSDTYARHPALGALTLDETRSEDGGPDPESRQWAPP